MAKILYEVKQNQNEQSAANGRWFAWVKTLETMNTRKLAHHIAEHGSVYTPDIVYGVLEKFRSCLVEMLLDSKKVKIDGLGTFYTTLENTKRGALKKEDYNPSKHMKALHIRFLPEQTTEQNISSREFLKQAEFINVEQLLKGEEAESGGSTSGGSQQSGSGNTGGNTSGSGNQGGSTGDNTGGGTVPDTGSGD
jgi:predicted histone-like DNA-binding protein